MNKLKNSILNSRLLFLKQNKFQDDDVFDRRKYILNVLLISFLVMAVIAQILIFGYLLITNSQPKSLILTLRPTIGFVFFLILLKLSSKNKVKTAAFFFLLTLFLLVFRSSTLAGVDNPQTIVIYSLIIIMSGILIGPKFSLVSTIIICLSLFGLFWLQQNSYISFNAEWRKSVFGTGDLFILLLSYLITAVVAWLFCYEIINALKRARKSEKEALVLANELQKEKDTLEIKVVKRTKELRESQLRELTRITNLAEFGKLSAGLLHDIKNPLTVISLNLDSLRNSPKNKMVELINRSLLAAKTAETIIKSSQKQLSNEEEKKQKFDLIQEIKNTLLLIEHRAEREKVRISFNDTKKIILKGYPAKISRIIANLMMNAIDSFKDVKRNERKIDINIIQNKSTLTIEINDNGCGISEEDKSSLFQPFFSRKKDTDRMGLGLYGSKKIIKDYFGGNIEFESTLGKGSSFSVIIPQNDK